nr:GGDEF domain-containing protein [Desulfuromonas sp.]
MARVKVQLKIKSLQDKLKKSNQLLLELSNTDPLTRLHNRRSLMQTLRREFQRSRRIDTPLSLVMADIDHFKKVNDTYGHQQGDSVLVALGDLFNEKLRPYDLAARFGGEEFALVLPETDLANAQQVAERIREAAARLTFPGPLKELRLTISLGVATFPSGNIQSEDDLIREADYALYNAKRGGRNRVEPLPG